MVSIDNWKYKGSSLSKELKELIIFFNHALVSHWFWSFSTEKCLCLYQILQFIIELNLKIWSYIYTRATSIYCTCRFTTCLFSLEFMTESDIDSIAQDSKYLKYRMVKNSLEWFQFKIPTFWDLKPNTYSLIHTQC